MALLWRDRELLVSCFSLPERAAPRCPFPGSGLCSSSVISRNPRFHILLYVCSPLRHRGYDSVLPGGKTGIAARCGRPGGEMNVVKEPGMTQHWVGISFQSSLLAPPTSPDRPFPCTSCRCFRAQVQTLGGLISACQVRVQSRLPPSVTPPRRWCGEAPLPPPPLTTIEPHWNQTPVSQDCLVESPPDPGPRRCQPWGQSMARQRRPAPPGADMDANLTPVNIVVIPASHSPQVSPCLYGRGRRTPGKRTIEPGKSIIALHNAAPGILI